MTPRKIFSHLLLALPLFAGNALPTQMVYAQSAETAEAEPEKGPHRGRMLRDVGGFGVAGNPAISELFCH